MGPLAARRPACASPRRHRGGRRPTIWLRSRPVVGVRGVRVGRKQGGPSSTGGRAAGKVVPLKEGAEMVRATLDDTDLAILRALQANARDTYTEIGRAVGVAAPPGHYPLQRLEQPGVIPGYRAELDPDAVGLTVLSLVSVLPSDN